LIDGCTGGKAGEIVTAAKLGRAVCRDITSEQAAGLLRVAREAARPVKPERLGAVGPDAYPAAAYAQMSGVAEFGALAPLAAIPFVVEVWGAESDLRRSGLTVCVNRTPVTAECNAYREKRGIYVVGCGLTHQIAQAPATSQFSIVVNVISPYVPITSDGKEPDLTPFVEVMAAAAEKAVRKAHRPQAGRRTSQKDVVLDNLDDAIADVSGDGEYRFNTRQILYVVRKIVSDETGQTLTTANFDSIITDHEAEHGEIAGMYREPRGTLYHPHRGETITIGTLMVEDYERPVWTYNKIVYIEKEGFAEALKDSRWCERHDCATASSKGFTTRAVRDLVDKLAEHDEPVTVFCVHDADAYGTMIYQTFQQETRARGARKIKIVNLGLEPWEGIEMGLEIESVKEGERHKPVADYVCERDDGDHWEQWLQTNRIELNAMTTPEFIAWLDGKVARYEKLIPPAEVLEAELNERIESKIRDAITSRILREADVDGQVAEALTSIRTPASATLTAGVQELFRRQPDRHWRHHVEEVASECARSVDANGAAP
jgi:post-segregation antitoxin (ccd killing protein)